MKFRSAVMLLLVLGGSRCFGNNGVSKNSSDGPFVVIESAQHDGQRRFKDTCGGTNSSGFLETPASRLFIISAAHCFITDRLMRIHGNAMGAAKPLVRRIFALSAPWTDDRLVALQKALSKVAESGSGNWDSRDFDAIFPGGYGNAGSGDWDKFLQTFWTLNNHITRMLAFEHLHILYTVKGDASVLPLKSKSVQVHPLYLAQLLVEEDGTNGTYDLAIVASNLTQLRALPLADKVDDIVKKKMSLNGNGLQIDIVQPGHLDYDRDKVLNRSDLCPWSPIGATVDQDGCAAQDKRLTKSFRSGWRKKVGALKVDKSSMFTTADANSYEYFSLKEMDLKIQDEENTTPGKGDSGSSLVFGNPWEIDEKKLPFIGGVYHGSRGPTDQGKGPGQPLAVVARYENILRPSVQSWLHGRILGN